MKRYFRIYSLLLKLSFQSLLAYRMNFINSVISSIIWSFSGLLITFLLTAKTPSVFGWSRDSLLLLSAGYNVFFGIFYFFFSRNFAELTRIIHVGELDGYLLRPIDSQFALTFWQQSYAQVIRITIGICFIIFLLHHMHADVTIATIGIFLLFLFFGLIIMYGVWFSVLTLTVWFTNLSNLIDFMYTINPIVKYPQEMYKGFSQFLFFGLFPLTVALVIPIKALFRPFALSDMLALMITALCLFFFSRFFWRFALRFYTSASG